MASMSNLICDGLTRWMWDGQSDLVFLHRSKDLIEEFSKSQRL